MGIRGMIHPKSHRATSGEFAHFGVPSTSLAIESNNQYALQPISSLDKATRFEFEIIPTDDSIDLANIYLECKFKFTKADGGNLIDANIVTPSQYFLNTMFSSVDVKIKEKTITPQYGNYHYRSYLDNVFFATEEAKDTFLYGSGWASETQRKALVALSRECQLMGRLHIDFFRQPLFLTPLTPINIVFTLNKPQLMCKLSGVDDVGFTMLDMKLWIRKFHPDSEMRHAIEKGLSISPARYFFSQNVVSTRNIPINVTQHLIPDVVSGVLPRLFLVGFVYNEDYAGKFNSDCLKFAHCDINYIAGYKGGVLLNGGAFTPDYTNNNYQREYIELFRALGQDNILTKIKFSYEQFKSDYCFYAFNLTPDFSNNPPEDGIVTPIEQDSINLEVKFKTAPTKTVTMITYSLYDKYLEVDQNREANNINFP